MGSAHPACASQTDVWPAKPAVPQALCALEKPRDQMLLPGVLAACRFTVLRMLQVVSRDPEPGLGGEPPYSLRITMCGGGLNNVPIYLSGHQINKSDRSDH